MRNEQGDPHGRPAAIPITDAASVPRAPTQLQAAFLDYVAALDRIESLNGRQRAVCLDLARRRLRHVLDGQLALLEEWDLAA